MSKSDLGEGDTSGVPNARSEGREGGPGGPGPGGPGPADSGGPAQSFCFATVLFVEKPSDVETRNTKAGEALRAPALAQPAFGAFSAQAQHSSPKVSPKPTGKTTHRSFFVTTSNKCIATSNKCLTSSNKKLVNLDQFLVVILISIVILIIIRHLFLVASCYY